MDIIELLKTEKSQGKIITELMNGRNAPIPPTEKVICELDPEYHDVMNPAIRRDKWVKADAIDTNTANGTVNLSIDTTNGGATRIERVERIALALQKLIVNRAVSFTFGNPVSLSADTTDNTKEDDVLKSVRRVLNDVKSTTVNRRVARSIFSCTEAAELWYPALSPNQKYGFSSNFKLRCKTLSPINGDQLYPYFDDTGDMIAFSRTFYIEDAKKVKTTYFETYTADSHILWTSKNNQWELVNGYPQVNPIGKIPIIYGRQDKPEWADVNNLINRLEKLLSNFADTNDYHASPKIVVKGEIEGWSKKGDSGSVITVSDDGSVDYLTWSQAPECVKLEIETLLRMIYTLTQTPDISFDSVKGLNVSGVALELMFMDAHLKVKDKCEIFDEYMQRRISVILSYLSMLNAGDSAYVSACNSISIEPEITPYSIKDDQNTINMLMTATGQKQILSQKSAVNILGYVDDAEKELARIKEDDAAAGNYADIFNQEPTQ